ncbi:MAG: hypothetical protein FWD96_05865 [Defluviitaleaceae bacterium]|nr:hypothetical protein [Defluviitaleaceae bacterium]
MNRNRSRVIRFFLPAVIVATVMGGISFYYRTVGADQMGFLTGDYSAFFGTTLLVVGAIGIVQLFLRRGSRGRYDKYNAYMEEDREANLSRKRDIDNTMIIRANFPQSACVEEGSGLDQLIIKQKRAQEASTGDMMKLSLSNIELKRAFGPQNLDYIARCEMNFNNYVKALTEWAEDLLNAERKDAARVVLEEAVNVGAETSRVYMQLANLYREGGKRTELAMLLKKAQDPAFLANDEITRAKILASVSSGINSR